MRRRSFLLAAAAAAATNRLGAQAPSPAPTRQPSRDTLQQKRETLVIDAMGELRPEYTDDILRAMLRSGMDAITITLCDPKPEGDEALALALDSLVETDKYLASRPDLFIKASTVADIDRARRAGKLAVFYLYQNTVQFGTSLDRIDLFHRLGLRSCQMTYNTKNHVGVGCWEQGGITPFGRQSIARLNERRMLIDLSHANAQTMRETIAESRQPVIISHTACMAVHENRRNTPDDVLKQLADRGGVVGVCQMRPFLTSKRGKEALPFYFDHIMHAIKVAGIEHVGIGSDRDHRVITLSPEYVAELKKEEGSQVQDTELPYFIDELNGPSRMEVVRDGLVKRGLPSRDVERVMGGNVYRLYREVIG
ncbi:MAG: membrane dipeptidase [Gemmatimonadaceae bacterium]